MRRGFKTWCERKSGEYRSDLGLSLCQKLEPKSLAKYLKYEVLAPEEILGLPTQFLNQLTVKDKDSWSAITIRESSQTLIIVNSAHAQTRQRSSLSHELSHLILGHTPNRSVISPKGHLLLSNYGGDQEDEADWLSATLLVPRTGLLRMYRKSEDPAGLAAHFGVSRQLLEWRLHMTGVLKQSRRGFTRRP